ncbi:GNAT family N-acetyltransferase [Alkalimonas collagenimarina]|uniref:GNAT family N-acetyltransferase n=1 Tax=Alkalimonas collagenimarina TaxID=400390 RepID=A0ABT9GZ60_9GAMM|nr:GNAT family N-acetyltransferase [Alkalimonas collagenimarina]MDP4536360.1 GNAT family N-acetyltransferase [Alkalimonas collagenimarina]
MAITTEVIEDIQQLTTLNFSSDFFTNAELSTALCTTAEWLTHWLTHYLTPQDRLFICCHRLGSKFIAIYPLYLKKITLGYELRFIGTGEPEDSEVCSEFQDFIIHPYYLNESLTLFTEQVQQLATCYRICFDNILSDSHCFHWLKGYTKTGWRSQHQLVGQRFVMPVAISETDQIKQLVQSGLRRHARRFTERHDIDVIYCNEQNQLEEFFSDLIQLHNSHWQSRGKAGAFSSQKFCNFHKKLASSMLQQKNLLLFKLVCQSQTIAVFYGFYHNLTLYYYQSGISSLSPLPNTGIAIHLIALQNAREKQVGHYDLMKGRSSSYKQQYVAATTPVYSINHSVFWLSAFQTFHKTLLPSRLKRWSQSVRLAFQKSFSK